MVEYNIVKAHNQRFNVQVNGQIVEFVLHEFRGLEYVSVFFDGKCITPAIPAVGQARLIPRSFDILLGGNFMFATIGGEYPSYETFGTPMCKLVFTGEDMPNGTV